MIGEFIAAPDRWSGDPAFVARCIESSETDR
jgi:hypothetical protein